MIQQTLTALIDDVERLVQAGAAVAASDERLPVHAQTLRQLGQRLPPLLQLADAVERIPGRTVTEAAAPLMDLLVLVRQLQASMAAAGFPGMLEPLNETHGLETRAPITELVPSIDNENFRRRHVGTLPLVKSDMRFQSFINKYAVRLLEDN
jgi:hypothetical protein